MFLKPVKWLITITDQSGKTFTGDKTIKSLLISKKQQGYTYLDASIIAYLQVFITFFMTSHFLNLYCI